MNAVPVVNIMYRGAVLDLEGVSAGFSTPFTNSRP